MLIFKPLIEIFRDRGHQVQVTARVCQQTVPLLERFGIEHTLIGAHRGRSRIGKAIGLASRSRALRKWAATRDFDLAVSHGSNDLALAAHRLGVPHVTMQDYEFNTVSHRVNFPRSVRIVFPDVVPAEALEPFGATSGKLVQYPGIKEEYYLHGFQPDEQVAEELGIDRDRIIVTLRPPATEATYHRFENPLFDRVLGDLARRDDVTCVVLPRYDEQRKGLASMRLPNVIIPEDAVDAQSLTYFSDLVVSAGGTMIREAAALGVPAYTIFAGELGAVDKSLISDGRVKRISSPADIALVKRDVRPMPTTRDPNVLADLISSALIQKGPSLW